jgi:hypothetical protein
MSYLKLNHGNSQVNSVLTARHEPVRAAIVLTGVGRG